jgi:hypothetical protein
MAKDGLCLRVVADIGQIDQIDLHSRSRRGQLESCERLLSEATAD